MSEHGDILILIEARDDDVAALRCIDSKRGIRVGPYLSEPKRSLDAVVGTKEVDGQREVATLNLLEEQCAAAERGECGIKSDRGVT